MAAKTKVTTKEGQPDLSGSTTSLPLQTNAPRRTTLGPSTQPPPKVGAKSPPIPNETRGVGGGTTNKSATRLPLTVGSMFPTFLIRRSETNLLIDNPLASGSKVTLEEGREPHVPPKGVMENEDRKELGVGFGPFSFGRMFFSLQHSVNRAGGIDLGGNKTATKGVQRGRRVPPMRDRLTLLEAQPQWILGSYRPPPFWLISPHRAAIIIRLSTLCLDPALTSTLNSHSIL